MIVTQPDYQNMAGKVCILKILSILSSTFLGLAIYVIIITPPASGYELSIYDSYPLYFWFFIIGSIACGICILVLQAFSQQESNWWLIGFYEILLTNLCILLLPIFRGYAIYGRGDPLHHIGNIRDILSTGHLWSENFYPVIHILAAGIVHITSLDMLLVVKMLPPLFTILYIVSIYLLATSLTKSRRHTLLITAFGSILLYRIETVVLTPTYQSFFLLPFVLFLYNKAQMQSMKSIRYTVLYILVLFFVLFFHPVMVMALILIFLLYTITLMLYKQMNKHKQINSKNIFLNAGDKPKNPLLLLSVTFFTWYSLYSVFAINVRTVSDSLLHRVSESEFEAEYSSFIREVGLSAYELTVLFLRTYGQYLLYSILAIVVCIVICRRAFSLNRKINFNMVLYSLLFIAFGMLTLVILGGHFGFGWGRIMVYTIFTATILNGLGIATLVSNRKVYDLRNKKLLNAERMLSIIIIVFLISTASVQLYSMYFFPIVRGMANPQVTNQEVDGMQWFLHARDPELLIDEMGISQHRFATALLGIEVMGKKNIRYEAMPPDHFDYTHNETELRGQNKYLIISENARVYYRQLYLEYPMLASSKEFVESDFDKLNHNSSMSKLYSNGGFDIIYGSL